MNLPNVITLSRIIFLAAVFWLAYEPWYGAATLALLLALAGAVSDWLDGWLARRANQISNFGKLMDALVDKVFVLGLLGLLLQRGLLPAWGLALVILIVLRDLLITAMRGWTARRGVVLAADQWGKRKTIWQVTSICILLAVPAVERDLAGLVAREVHLLALFLWLNGILYFILSSILALYSGALYMVRYLPLMRRPGGSEL